MPLQTFVNVSPLKNLVKFNLNVTWSRAYRLNGIGSTKIKLASQLQVLTQNTKFQRNSSSSGQTIMRSFHVPYMNK
jgi:hypothetical protein